MVLFSENRILNIIAIILDCDYHPVVGVGAVLMFSVSLSPRRYPPPDSVTGEVCTLNIRRRGQACSRPRIPRPQGVERQRISGRTSGTSFSFVTYCFVTDYEAGLTYTHWFDSYI